MLNEVRGISLVVLPDEVSQSIHRRDLAFVGKSICALGYGIVAAKFGYEVAARSSELRDILSMVGSVMLTGAAGGSALLTLDGRNQYKNQMEDGVRTGRIFGS